jgi:acetyltransferase-like isoleucine patch superfamily enzyme
MLVILRFFCRIYIFIFHGRCYSWVTKNIRFFRPLYETRGNESPIFFKQWFRFKVLGKGTGPYWTVHKTSKLTGDWRNVFVGIDASPGISPGCYIQAVGKIYIDDHAQIAPSVGIISANHFMLDVRKHLTGEVRIGKYCSIGMGSIILPGVVLGDFTTVAAGSVVTKSFPNGYCVISGNPAAIVHDYSGDEKIRNKFVRYKNDYEYHGFIPAAEFEAFRKQYLNV